MINFTTEELLYIEKMMDINCSYGLKNLKENIELYFLICEHNKEYKKIIANNILELQEAQNITNSIRHKIEKWRKENEATN